MNASASFVEVSFEHCEAMPNGPVFGVARVSRSTASNPLLAVGRRVLAPAPGNGVTTCDVEVGRCIQLNEALPTESALRVPDLALAMAIWDAIQLELGEVAVYTSGLPHESLVAKVAEWRTCRDVIRLNLHDGDVASPAGILEVDASDPQRAIETIQEVASGAPGFAAVVLSPKPEALDVLLESMPMWGRLVIASMSTEAATIDFYNNVHRKGVRVVCLPASSSCLFDTELHPAVSSFTGPAMSVLLHEELAAACRDVRA